MYGFLFWMAGVEYPTVMMMMVDIQFMWLCINLCGLPDYLSIGFLNNNIALIMDELKG
jgi:hypothetical protein